MRCILVLVAGCMMGAPLDAGAAPHNMPLALGVSGAAPSPRVRALHLIDRLSSELRERRLDANEWQEVTAALAEATDLHAVYERYLDRWLDEKTVGNYSQMGLLRGGISVTALFMKLSSVQVGDQTLLFLASSAANPTEPCPPAERVQVTPWWNPAHKVAVCKSSYRPEHVFDDVGFCAGQPEPTVQTPPRPGCGCGPLLLACLPPAALAPKLEESMDAGIREEVMKTAADIVTHHRSFNELWTTSTTWQSGLVEFLYLRRELVGQIKNTPYSPALDQALLQRLKTVNLAAPGHWVDRKGIYAGSGIYLATLANDISSPSYRGDLPHRHEVLPVLGLLRRQRR